MSNVIIEDDLTAVHFRPYDPTLGDLRKFTQIEAVAEAEMRASDTGVRQVVRPRTEKPTPDDHVIPRWLVQAI